MASRRNGTRAAGLLPLGWVLLVGGCTTTAGVVGPGDIRFTFNQPVPTNNAPPPPGLVGNAEAVALPPMPKNGYYAGFGYNIVDPGGMCAGKIRIFNFVVNGTAVRFGAFSGVIEPDGRVRLQAGGAYIFGQFVGTHFEGRFWQPGPVCTYSMELEPVA